MSELNKEKHAWQFKLAVIKLAVIGGSAIIGAYGSAYSSMLILFSLGGDGPAGMGGFLGAPIGFLVGGGMAMWLLGKQIQFWKVIVTSILVASLSTSLLLTGLGLVLMWLEMR